MPSGVRIMICMLRSSSKRACFAEMVADVSPTSGVEGSAFKYGSLIKVKQCLSIDQNWNTVHRWQCFALPPTESVLLTTLPTSLLRLRFEVSGSDFRVEYDSLIKMFRSSSKRACLADHSSLSWESLLGLAFRLQHSRFRV